MAKKSVKKDEDVPAKTSVKKVSKKVAEPVIQVQETTQPPLSAVEPYSRFTDFDVALFRSGKHYKLYEKFGSHVIEHKGVTGTYFAVWAPNAKYVAVIGNFNGWNRASHPLMARWDSSG